MDKTLPDPAAAVAGIEDGMSVMIGGFGGSGAPIELIHALIDRYLATGHPKDLTVINNNAGNGHVGLAALIEQGMVATLICSFPRSADPVVFTEAYKAGRIRLELGAAGHAGRTHPRGRRGYPGLLHAHGLRHRAGRGQARRGIRWPPVCARALAQGGLRAGPGASRRHDGQPDLPHGRAQFRPADVHGGQGQHRSGLGTGGAGRDRPRGGRHPPASSCRAWSRSPPPRRKRR